MSFNFDNITLESTSDSYSFFNKYLCDEIKEELNYEYDIKDCEVELSDNEEITLTYELTPERNVWDAKTMVLHKLLFNTVYTIIKRYGEDPLKFVDKFKFSLFDGNISSLDLSVIHDQIRRGDRFMIYGEHAEQENRKFKIKDIPWFVYQIIMMQSLYNNRCPELNRTAGFLLKHPDNQISFFNFDEIKEFISLLGTYGGPMFSNINTLGKFFSYQYARSIKTFIWDNLHHNNVKLPKKIVKHTDFMKMDLIPLCQLIMTQKAFKK